MLKTNKSNNKNLTAFIIVIVLLLSAIIFFNRSRFSEPSSLKMTVYAAEIGANNTALTAGSKNRPVISTKIDTAVFSDPKFQTLVDNLPAQYRNYSIGKTDIFQP